VYVGYDVGVKISAGDKRVTAASSRTGLTSRYHATDVHLALVDPSDAAVERIWRELTEATPPSYFLSWGWIETWLACLPGDRAPQLALFGEPERPVAACFLGRRFGFRHNVVPTRTLHLNTTGVARLDELWIEYNGLVGRDLSLGELVDSLPRRWDELFLPGLSERALGGVADGAIAGDARVRVDRRVPAYYVDLAKVRAGGYLPLLSGQTRSQVKRAQREAGKLAVEVARDPSHAIDIYSELCALHAAQWRAKGQPGAFADPWFDRFHRRLIGSRLAHGEIQLLRVRGPEGTIGCLYNFVWQGRVLQYQSGLASYEDPRRKPGYVTHAAAIEHSAGAGLAIYDLLGGDMRYKKSLSTDGGELLWARVQRRRLRFAIEDRLIAMRRRRAQESRP
jgi:CelD/BcsL family acetyltransferase involved in cellulose biosynthesis